MKKNKCPHYHTVYGCTANGTPDDCQGYKGRKCLGSHWNRRYWIYVISCFALGIAIVGLILLSAKL